MFWTAAHFCFLVRAEQTGPFIVKKTLVVQKLTAKSVQIVIVLPMATEQNIKQFLEILQHKGIHHSFGLC